MRDMPFGDDHPSLSSLWILMKVLFYIRPEAIESLFIAFRLTGDERFRKHGWDIFQAIEAHCRVETGGYAGLLNVDASPITRLDEMETFFLVRKSHELCAERIFADRGAE
jgi:hypothetical protein